MLRGRLQWLVRITGTGYRARMQKSAMRTLARKHGPYVRLLRRRLRSAKRNTRGQSITMYYKIAMARYSGRHAFTPLIMALLDLPLELIYDVADQLSSKYDLNAFVQVNRLFYRTFNQKLYRLDRKHCNSSALLWSAACGQQTTMRHSLGARVGLNDQVQSIQKAFFLTVEHGECSASLLLLRNGADVNAHCGYFGHALQTASWLSDYNMMELLLNNGADVNALGGHYGNALQATSWTGNEQTVNLLLDRNASVHAQGGYFGNALQSASWAGNTRTVEILIGQGSDVNAQGGFYGNALQAASSRGHLQVVKVLLRAGADVNARGGYFGSALQAALNYGHIRVAGLLQHCVWQSYWSSVFC